MDFAELLEASRTDRDARPNGGAIAFGALEIKQNAMVTVSVHVLEKRRSFADIEHDNIDVAGVEDVAEGGAAAALHRKAGQARFLGDFIEGSVAIVAVEQNGFAIARAGFDGIDLWKDVAIGDENVEPGIVIHVEETGAPADQTVILLANAGGPAYVLETLRAEIFVEPIGLLGKMRDEEAETSTVVEVSEIHAHVAELHALAAQRQAGEHAYIGESAVVIVVVEVVGHGIIGDEEVGPTVVIIVSPHHA